MPRRAHPADLVSNNSLHFCGGEPTVPTIIVIANREGITVAWGFREDNFHCFQLASHAARKKLTRSRTKCGNSFRRVLG